MNGLKLKITSCAGFTLIEIIATIIMMGIMAAFFINFMGTAIDDSYKSVDLVAGEAEAEGKIEEIIAYYTSKINQDPDNALADIVSEFSGQAIINYVIFDPSGTAAVVAGPTTTLQVTVDAPGNNLTTILTTSRANSTDPKVNF